MQKADTTSLTFRELSEWVACLLDRSIVFLYTGLIVATALSLLSPFFRHLSLHGKTRSFVASVLDDNQHSHPITITGIIASQIRSFAQKWDVKSLILSISTSSVYYHYFRSVSIRLNRERPRKSHSYCSRHISCVVFTNVSMCTNGHLAVKCTLWDIWRAWRIIYGCPFRCCKYLANRRVTVCESNTRTRHGSRISYIWWGCGHSISSIDIMSF